MAAPTKTQLREALAENLATLGDGIQINAYQLANPTPPAGHLYPADTTYDLALQRGLDRHAFTVQVFVGQAGDIAAQKTLDQYLSPADAKSVKAALESDQTLGGYAQTVRVVSDTGYRQYITEGRPPLLGCEWRVEVLATGH